ncbi:flagellar basal body P-ring formation chaperone FlgA [Pelagibius sp. 7325]|uniref:flagellar basal body P-ring formation chaperone FlgA n=1 Tax=Pelagibius sp. 7325 TaxID=3131994 RepID=UPI0030EB2A5A
MHSMLNKAIAAVTLGILLVLAAAVPAPAAGKTAKTVPAAGDIVILRAETLVEDAVVRLHDLFDGISDPALAETPVARAPEPGVSIEIGTRWLYALAKAHDLPWQPRSRYERVNLTRASRDVPAAEVEAALRLALAEQGIDGDVQLSFDNPDLRLRLPSTSGGGVKVTRLTLDPSNGRFLAQVVAPAAGEPAVSLGVTGRALAMTEIPVLTRNVKPGEVIRDRDIEWMSVQANRLTRTAVLDSASLVGMSPRRPIRAQDIVRSSDLETPVVVAKNSLVTIRLRTQRMELSVQGRALEAGAQGDVIRVMNTKSNNVVNAEVVDSGAVIVVPASITAQR